MLPDARTPFYGDDPWSWPRSLYKASTGSAKAFDAVVYAEKTFMIDVTGNPNAPEELGVNTLPRIYDAVLGTAMPPQRILDHAFERRWFPHRLLAGERPALEGFVDLWGRRAASEARLLVAAAHRASERWTGAEIVSVWDESSLDADATHLVSAMLLMSLTWPEPPSFDAGLEDPEAPR